MFLTVHRIGSSYESWMDFTNHASMQEGFTLLPCILKAPLMAAGYPGARCLYPRVPAWPGARGGGALLLPRPGPARPPPRHRPRPPPRQAGQPQEPASCGRRRHIHIILTLHLCFSCMIHASNMTERITRKSQHIQFNSTSATTLSSPSRWSASGTARVPASSCGWGWPTPPGCTASFSSTSRAWRGRASGRSWARRPGRWTRGSTSSRASLLSATRDPSCVLRVQEHQQIL